jgi:hypothetical protein
MPSSRSTGLLCGLDLDESFAASFTWRDRELAEPTLASALWRKDPSSQTKQVIEIRCEVTCLFCNRPLVSAERTIASTSEHELVCRVAVIPICPTCIRMSNENPDYWRECLRQITSGERPQLTCIPGGGEGDGVPHGVVCLVPAGEE